MDDDGMGDTYDLSDTYQEIANHYSVADNDQTYAGQNTYYPVEDDYERSFFED